MKTTPIALFLSAAPIALLLAAEPTYTSTQLCAEFYAEGAAAADINADGHIDIFYGPHWYAGPDWKEKHAIYEPKPFKPDNEYSENFVAYAVDLNSDQAPDYLVLGFPGKWAYWLENPKKTGVHWKRHNVLNILDNESPAFTDITGDGKAEIICSSGGYFGYAQPDWADATKPWVFQRISEKQLAGGKFTHGLGVGDVNGDGKLDLLEKNGWWEQPATAGLEWKQHSYEFSQKGGAQMYAYDFDGDGDNDVLSSEHAHGYGLRWFENQGAKDGEIQFTPHRILGSKPEENAQGIVFSQLHGVDLADMNGDGVMDIITGKRWMAHGSKGDDEPLANPVIYWFETKPGKKSGQASFHGHRVHDQSGVGTQVTALDLNKDGAKDILVGNKRGLHVHLAQKLGNP